MLTSRARNVLSALVLLTLVAAAVSTPVRDASATEAVTAGTTAQAAPPGKRPNILLISTDDQAADDMRFMPFTRQYFAEHGTTFTDAVSPYPLCCPARATILTGQLSHNHRVMTNRAPYGGYDAFLNSGLEDKSLPTWLQTAGYDTMFAGKYLNGYGEGEYREWWPSGWDDWNGIAGTNSYSYFDFNLLRNGVMTSYPDGYQTEVLGEITRDYIQTSSAARPFFIWESDLAPHGACIRHTADRCVWGPPQPAEQDAGKFSALRLNRPRDASFNERVVVDKPDHIRNTPAWGRAKLRRVTWYNQQRARSLQAVDRSLKATIDTLERTGELANTLVIFTSDNGFLIGQHRWQGKMLPYEPSLRVPLMMSGPGIPAGMSTSETVALVDLASTIAAAAGATPVLAQDGQPLQPVAAGTRSGYGALAIEAGPLRPEAFPKWLYHGVRTRRYTYVVYPELNDVELYDRLRDPDETTNVAYRPAYRDTRAALDQKLDALQECAGDACYSVSGDGVPDPRPEPYLAGGATVHPDELGSVGSARRVVTVTAPNWRTGRGQLTAWARSGRTWTVQAGPFRVRLGSHGLIQQRRRRGGSGETPAGTFTVDTAFGLKAAPRTALAYRKVGGDDYWVSDHQDPRTYNINQPRRSPRAAWRVSRSVRWASHPSRFGRGLVMDYNLPAGVTRSKRFGELRSGAPADVRKGSLVLHTGSRLGVNGWVSMPSRRMTWLLRWLRRDSPFVIGTPEYLRGRL